MCGDDFHLTQRLFLNESKSVDGTYWRTESLSHKTPPSLTDTHITPSFRSMLRGRHDFLLLSDTERRCAVHVYAGPRGRWRTRSRRPHRGTFSGQLFDAIWIRVVTPFIRTTAPSHLRFGCYQIKKNIYIVRRGIWAADEAAEGGLAPATR